MLGLSGISNRYFNFRINQGYDYPSVFIALGAMKFLAQVAVVAGLAWYGVTLVTKQSELLVENPVAASPAPTKLAIAPKQSLSPVEIPAAAAPVTNTFVVKPVVNEVPVISEAPGKSLNTLLKSDWIMKQKPSAFTIQFGTSPDKELLYQSAKTFDSEFPVVVFPFKRTPTNRPVYGFASGIYDSLEDAKQGVLDLPKSAFTYGPWVRPIGKLQKQIKAMSR